MRAPATRCLTIGVALNRQQVIAERCLIATAALPSTNALPHTVDPDTERDEQLLSLLVPCSIREHSTLMFHLPNDKKQRIEVNRVPEAGLAQPRKHSLNAAHRSNQLVARFQ